MSFPRSFILAFLTFLTLSSGDLAAQVREDKYMARAALNSQDYITAKRIYEALASSGDADAYFALGFIHNQGLGVLKSDEIARNHMIAAAELGHAEASSFICRDEFKSASSTSEYRNVLDTCWFAATQKLGPRRGRLTLDPLFYARARYFSGVAFDNLGEEWMALLCYTSAFIFLDGKPGYEDELEHIRKRMWKFAVDGNLKISPKGLMPEFELVVEPCMISRSAFASMIPQFFR